MGRCLARVAAWHVKYAVEDEEAFYEHRGWGRCPVSVWEVECSKVCGVSERDVNVVVAASLRPRPEVSFGIQYRNGLTRSCYDYKVSSCAKCIGGCHVWIIDPESKQGRLRYRVGRGVEPTYL
jgi:hypothetical protein